MTIFVGPLSYQKYCVFVVLLIFKNVRIEYDYDIRIVKTKKSVDKTTRIRKNNVIYIPNVQKIRYYNEIPRTPCTRKIYLFLFYSKSIIFLYDSSYFN